MTAAEPLVPAVDPYMEKSLLERAAERLAQTRPLTWFFVNVGNRIDPFLMRVSGGRLNTTGSPMVVVLHHTGAKTGKARQTPLAYFTEGRDVVLVASNGGARHHPSWLYNIRANPDVELWVGDKGGAHTARVATPDEKGRLWPKANALYAGYAGYQTKSGRDIQMIICSPKE